MGLRFVAATREKHSVNERDSAPAALVSQEKYPLLVGVGFRKAFRSSLQSRFSFPGTSDPG
jgi:hypothetical protein